MNVGNTAVNAFGSGGESILNTPRRPSEERGAFWSALSAACAEKPGDSEMLFRSVDPARKSLSDEDLAALAEKYDPNCMTAEQYRSFLDDLEELGAITAADRKEMGTYCMTVTLAGYTDDSGRYVDLTAAQMAEKFLAKDPISAAGGSLQKLLKSLQSGSRKGETLDLLAGITERVDAAQTGGKSLVEAAKEPGGAFWLGLRQTIVENAKQNEELRKEQEAIEMMTLMLDAASGRITPAVSAASGLRLGMNADNDVIKSGTLTELQAYMLVAGSRPEDEAPEEDHSGRVEAADESAAGKLDSGEDQSLSAGDLADLAEKYDPNRMTQEQYDRFLEDMVKLGAASRETIERIGYHGLAAVYDGDAVVKYVTDTPSAPPFQPSPIDGDIEGWINNRMLWKPGITRESMKRGGLSNEYEQIMEEQKTLSRIAAILADVRRQRYPSVEL